MYQLAPKTEFVAHAIASWITNREKDHGGPGDTLKVFNGSHEELSSGHVVSWEGGYEDWPYIVQNKIDDFVTFMGCWTEVVNHLTLAVYEKD